MVKRDTFGQLRISYPSGPQVSGPHYVGTLYLVCERMSCLSFRPIRLTNVQANLNYPLVV